MKTAIIDFIKRNRVSTTELADCMGKKGAYKNVAPITQGYFKAGNLFYVGVSGGSNWHVHKQIQYVKDDDIVLVEAFDTKSRAVFGDLVSKYLLLYKQTGAIVTNAKLRDAPRLIKEKWPIWCNGFTPIGYENKKVKANKKIKKKIEAKEKHYKNAIIVCDDTGVIIIPKKYHTQKFLNKIRDIEEQEDVWFDCIDTKKYSTFETVCLQKYKKKKND